jgi:hypothetical protein
MNRMAHTAKTAAIATIDNSHVIASRKCGSKENIALFLSGFVRHAVDPSAAGST